MKIHILSDLHTEFGSFEPPWVEADVVILAGDIGVGNGGLKWIQEHVPHTPVIYIAGNHEYYGRTLQKQLQELREATAGSHVHLLENDEVHLGDVVFLGCTLWTDFELFGDPDIVGYEVMQRMNDFSKIRVAPKYRKLHYQDAVGFHHRSVHWLEDKFEEHRGKKLVVVTHHAPSRQSIIEKYKANTLSAGFASDRDSLVAASGARLWVHGHVHSVHDYLLGETRVLCNPKGYPDEEVPGFNPALVLEV